MDCIFCKIANGEIPGTTLYEDDKVRVILDINPTVYGHALVIPKTHCDSLIECPDDVRDAVFATAQKLAAKMEKELGCDGVNVITNIREGAGQTVNHFHVHVLPRYTGHPEKDALQYAHGPIDMDQVNFEEIQEILSL